MKASRKIRSVAFAHAMAFGDGTKTYNDFADTAVKLGDQHDNLIVPAYYLLSVASFLPDTQELELRRLIATMIDDEVAQ